VCDPCKKQHQGDDSYRDKARIFNPLIKSINYLRHQLGQHRGHEEKDTDVSQYFSDINPVHFSGDRKLIQYGKQNHPQEIIQYSRTQGYLTFRTLLPANICQGAHRNADTGGSEGSANKHGDQQ